MRVDSKSLLKAMGEQGGPMLSPHNAIRIVSRAVGREIGQTSFYRWVMDGSVFAIRVNGRIFIPWPEVQRVIKACRAGERL